MRERIEPALFTVLLLSVGFAFSPNLDVQFTLPKLFWLRLIGAALVIAWLGRSHDGAIKPVPRPVLVGACLLLAWWTLTTATAASPFVALQGAPGRYNGLINAATFLLVFLISASLPARRQDLHTRILLITGTVVPLAVYTLPSTSVSILGLGPIPGRRPRSDTPFRLRRFSRSWRRS